MRTTLKQPLHHNPSYYPQHRPNSLRQNGDLLQYNERQTSRFAKRSLSRKPRRPGLETSFPKDGNRKIRTGISELCNDANHEDCIGYGTHDGETIFWPRPVPPSSPQGMKFFVPCHNRAVPIKFQKEVYCETCGSNQPMVEHEPQKDELNPYPWYDITCGTCYSIIAAVQIVPEDKPVEPSRAVEYEPKLVK